MGNDCLLINKNDNVGVLMRDIRQGEKICVRGKELIMFQDVDRGHKVALSEIPCGHHVIKYGFPIGHALFCIHAGELVHTHNMSTNLEGCLTYSYKDTKQVTLKKASNRMFAGFKRKNGTVGTRNELWVIPTVGCINGAAKAIVAQFNTTIAANDIDAVVAHTHPYGCSQLGDDHVNTRTIISDLIKHPNAGGVLVLGLGCENNCISELKYNLGDYDVDRTEFLVAQEYEDEVAKGVELLTTLYEKMRYDKRTDCPLSALRIGLKCGGSDSFSGITANPLLGIVSDYIVTHGGVAVLTEVAEMFGAETMLMERAENSDVFDKIVAMINNTKKYYMSFNLPIYNNPSPGNKAGGITTLEEKSLGCIEKSGSTTIHDVIAYGQIINSSGMYLLDCVANDSVSSTALGASGCQIVVFTSGRGTPLGSFIPTIKVATNSLVFNKKRSWFDYNAGSVLEGKSREDAFEELIEYIICVAGGEHVANENNNYREISIFKSGITL